MMRRALEESQVMRERERTLGDPSLLEAIARCLAKQDGQFVSAEEWMGDQVYRQRAAAVIDTIRNHTAGHRSGGLPRLLVAEIGEPIIVPDVTKATMPDSHKVVSKHFTKAQADTACSQYAVNPPTKTPTSKSSGHERVKYTVTRSGRRFKRWQVVAW